MSHSVQHIDSSLEDAPSSFFLYVVSCSDGSFYTGYTTDVLRRVEEHNSSPLGAKYTKARRPVTLVNYAAFGSKSEAMRAEYCFKRLSRSEKIRYLEQAGSSSARFGEILKQAFFSSSDDII